MEKEVEKKEIAYNILDEESNISLTKVIFTGNIVGKFNTWKVEQEYLNLNKDQSVEIYYTFPLNAGATITSFKATIGDKILKGVVKEKQQANKEYQQAIAKGDSAYMMESLNSNVFKLSLGRVMPDELVKITISYIETCDVYDNQIDIFIPTLVGQRYNDLVSNSLAREDKASYTCDFIVNIEKNLSIKDVNSSSHKIKVINDEQVISLNNRLNRDFKLSIELKKEFKTTALINGQYLLIDLMPELKELNERIQKKYVFVIDRSGSMNGRNINAVKELLKAVLAQLEADDFIEIISFGTHHHKLFNLLKTVRNVRTELNDYINALSANMGGTELLSALEASLSYANNANIIVITDGQVGNEDYICNQIANKIQNNHLYLFGLDMNVNTSFLDKISKVGHGKAYYFTPNEANFTNKLIRAFSNINGMISSKVKLYTKNKILDLYYYSDTLFNNEYWTVLLKLENLKKDIIITVDDKPIVIKKDTIKITNLELDKVFATCKKGYYETLMNRSLNNKEGYQDLIIQIAIENQIDSKYTSFLAINERDDKVYDVPQIEETPVENSFDFDNHNVMYDCFIPSEDFDSVKIVHPRFEYPSRVKKNMFVLEDKLIKFKEAINKSNIDIAVLLLLEINEMIKALSIKEVISERIKELVNEIRSMDESIYNQLFSGVQETIKTLFIAY
ncbi:MAG: VIT and VWA domain-containing protein [Acholeplasmataceae bacterium]|nr:VIT and VWA domain-containing protein [Acholeplasmataceae bacterium]